MMAFVHVISNGLRHIVQNSGDVTQIGINDTVTVYGLHLLHSSVPLRPRNFSRIWQFTARFQVVHAVAHRSMVIDGRQQLAISDVTSHAPLTTSPPKAVFTIDWERLVQLTVQLWLGTEQGRQWQVVNLSFGHNGNSPFESRAMAGLFGAGLAGVFSWRGHFHRYWLEYWFFPWQHVQLNWLLLECFLSVSQRVTVNLNEIWLYKR